MHFLTKFNNLHHVAGLHSTIWNEDWKETHDLKWSDIDLRSDDDGAEYFIYTQEH